MVINKTSMSKGILVALTLLSPSVHAAAEKPKTMDDMWKIIQAQQKQIDALLAEKQEREKVAIESTTNTPTTTTVATAQPSADVKKLEHKTDILTQEVEKLRTNMSIPEEAKYKSMYGLGPAASKIYQVGKGLSIGGYGEANYQFIVNDEPAQKNGDSPNNHNNSDFERLVLYAGYKFTDNILFNSELEFEHGSTDKNGSVSVEFAALDFFFDPMINARAGMVLMPMGFINQIHEPPFYFGNNRPEVERHIIPTTWRELGAGVFGELAPGLTYTAYGISGLNAADYNSNGIRSGRQSGSQARTEDMAFVGRLDYAPSFLSGLTFGGSAYLGNAGQDQTFAGQKADAFTQLYEGHLQWKYRGLEFRTLGAYGHIDDADILSKAKGQTVGSSNYGWYTELGYDVVPLLFKDSTQYLAPFFRYEQLDTISKAPAGYKDDLTKDRKIYQFGLQYKPIPNVVIKADYRNFTAKKGEIPDDFNLGFGFIF